MSGHMGPGGRIVASARRLACHSLQACLGICAVHATTVRADDVRATVPSSVTVRALPASLRETLLRAQASLAAGSSLDALRLYESALAAEPGNAYALSGRAAVYQKLGRLDDARRDLQQVIAAGGDGAAVEASLALLAAAEGMGNERMLRREKAGLAYDAVNGHILAVTGDFDGAADALGRALKLAPDSVTLLWNYAVVLDHLGRGPEAAAGYRRLLGSLPQEDHTGRQAVAARLNWLAPGTVVPVAASGMPALSGAPAMSAGPARSAMPAMSSAPAAASRGKTPAPLSSCRALPYGAFGPMDCEAPQP